MLRGGCRGGSIPFFPGLGVGLGLRLGLGFGLGRGLVGEGEVMVVGWGVKRLVRRGWSGRGSMGVGWWWVGRRRGRG
jgi:hypothetical protein